MFRLRLLIILILTASFCFSQQAFTSYSILNNNCTSRNSSLGGYPIGVFDSKDASTAIFLPSNLLVSHDKQLVINYNNHFADSDFGMVNYNFKLKEKGIFSVSLFYNNYGDFEYYTPSGNSLGNSFTASDWIFQLGHSKKLNDKIQIGFNLKFLGSVFEQYKSFAIGSDVSLTYFDEQKQLGGYLLFSNIGTSIKSYQESNTKNKLPFNSVLGINTKLKHAPIRFHLSYHHLNRWSFSSNSQTNIQTSLGWEFELAYNAQLKNWGYKCSTLPGYVASGWRRLQPFIVAASMNNIEAGQTEENDRGLSKGELLRPNFGVITIVPSTGPTGLYIVLSDTK